MVTLRLTEETIGSDHLARLFRSARISAWWAMASLKVLR
jgi:hypothetical protein